MASRLPLLLGILLYAIAVTESAPQVDMMVAITEMEQAGYFTFVTLLEMLQDKIPTNVTFFMPNDRMLARIPVPENAISEFVLGHVIPMPLFFNHLTHFPTGSMIPSYYAGHMLKVTNHNGMVYLNNVQVVRPNICTAGFSIRCHGINGVLVASGKSSKSPTLHPPTKKATPPTQTESSPIASLTPPPPSPASNTQDGALSPASRIPAGPKSAAPTLPAGPAHELVVFILCAVMVFVVC
ncbi:hypothetical protein EJ110_NYTH03127 [Nymphaea thermarum]|nr:hypothetical protein EJ110_NYTH03127 [Nymphaea thermarum]